MSTAMTTSVEAKSEKAARMAALGYVAAVRAGKCCLCGKQVAEGQYIGKMPDSWQVRSRQRWAHRRCRETLKDQIRAKAARLGIVVPADGGGVHG